MIPTQRNANTNPFFPMMVLMISMCYFFGESVLFSLPILEIKGTINMHTAVALIPRIMAKNPPESAAFTFNVEVIATIIGMYIELQNQIPFTGRNHSMMMLQ